MLKIVCAHWDLWWQREVLTSNIALAADWSIGIERWWNDTDGKNRSTLRKPVPLVLGSPRIPHWLVWVRNPGLHIERLVTGQPPETWHKNGQEWSFYCVHFHAQLALRRIKEPTSAHLHYFISTVLLHHVSFCKWPSSGSTADTASQPDQQNVYQM